MQSNPAIADLNFHKNEDIEGFYILADAQVKTTSAGKPFLTATLADATGQISAKYWDFSGKINKEDKGSVVAIQGYVSEYKGTPQITIQKMRWATGKDDYDMKRLVPSAPIDEGAAWNELCQMIRSIRDPEYQEVCETVIRRHEIQFRTVPAAKSVHHAFVSGLLMHTLNMAKCADFLSTLYGSVIDRDLLIAGTILHDVCKDEEFEVSDLGLVTDYTVPGSLLGHLYMGAAEVRDVCRQMDIDEEKSMLLQHLILAHHGSPEMGAAVVPQCAEAELLHYIDLIDSRMEIMAEAFATTEQNEFTQKIYALDKRVYKHT